MRYFDTFTGIGGFTLGIQLAYEQLCIENQKQPKTTGDTDGQSGKRPNVCNDGLTCVGYSEIDKYATQIYQQHFPNHKNYGDITKINAEELPDFELLVGGFPCQAFSIAGKRAGFNDTRGTLFFDIARILSAKRPRLLLLENVKGLLSHDGGRTYSTIIATLDELGYDIQWQVLNSKNHGVPQNRERVFIVGHLRGTSRPEVFPFTESNGVHLREITKEVSDAQRIYQSDGLAKAQKALGGGLGAKTGLYAVKKNMGQFVQTKDESLCIDKSYYKGFDNHGQRTGIQEGDSVRRLTPTECARLQGFPDDWCAALSDTQQYKCYGNAVTTNVIRDIMIKMLWQS